jgi:hypothetical protein
MEKPGGAAILARCARVEPGGFVFFRLTVYEVEAPGLTWDGVEAAVYVSPGAAPAPDAASRQPRAATARSRAPLAART